MINEITREVFLCLDNGCYIAALSLTLTLPDICGKAMFTSTNNKERYTKWVDEYALKEISSNIDIYGFPIPELNGDIIYSLRCALLHEGNPNVDKKYFNYFELLYQEQQGGKREGYTSIKEEYIDDKGFAVVKKTFSINIRELCFRICNVAKKYYNENKELFNFFNYDIVDSSIMARNVFRIPKKNIV